MSIQFWTCKCQNKRNAQGVPKCRTCGELRTECNVTESCHIVVTRKPEPARPKPAQKPHKAKLPPAIKPGETENFLTSTKVEQ